MELVLELNLAGVLLVLQVVVEAVSENLCIRRSVIISVACIIGGSIGVGVTGSVEGNMKDGVTDSVMGSIRGSVENSITGSIGGRTRDTRCIGGIISPWSSVGQKCGVLLTFNPLFLATWHH